MNDIQNILINHGCDAETITNVVNDFRVVVVKHEPLQSCLAMAVLLKLLATKGSDDPNDQLKMIFDIVDCYDINLH